MIIFLDGTRLESNDLNGNERIGRDPCIGVLKKADIENCDTHLGISDRILDEYLKNPISKFESHDGFDYVALNIPDKTDLGNHEFRISIYFRKNLLIFICEETCELLVLGEILRRIEANEIKNLTLERIFYEFFDQLTIGDHFYLETIEEEISAIEESLMTAEKKDYIKEIIHFRKKLLALKRYYDQMQDLSYAIEDNDNGLISEDMVRYFRMLSARTSRLSDSVSNLRDYISQIREAYQSQVNIDQNSTMKLLTSITAIFLPLTLIVGWYGMNFHMPEYELKFGYLGIIGISLTVALVSCIYFKKHKWF